MVHVVTSTVWAKGCMMVPESGWVPVAAQTPHTSATDEVDEHDAQAALGLLHQPPKSQEEEEIVAAEDGGGGPAG